jgi:hypothetical protein
MSNQDAIWRIVRTDRSRMLIVYSLGDGTWASTIWNASEVRHNLDARPKGADGTYTPIGIGPGPSKAIDALARALKRTKWRPA